MDLTHPALPYHPPHPEIWVLFCGGEKNIFRLKRNVVNGFNKMLYKTQKKHRKIFCRMKTLCTFTS